MKFINQGYDNNLFKENLEFLTKENDITKTVIEMNIGIGEGSLSRYCSNKAPRPSIDILQSIANGFGVTVDELINENIKEKRAIQKENEERKDIRFCNKLVEETNDNLIVWNKYSNCKDSDICDAIIISNPYEDIEIFNLNKLNKNYHTSEIDIIYAKINVSQRRYSGVEICILRLPAESEEICFAYELYIKRDGCEVINGGSSYLSSFLEIEIDTDLHNSLEKLYDSANYYINVGKDRFDREKIFDEYLNVNMDVEVDEDDMPF